MNRNFKKIVATICLLATLATLACGFTGCSQSGATIIGVGLYEDSGAAVTAVKSYLGSLESELNVSFQYVTLSQTDEAVNKTAVQSMISAGCQGLILTMDSATETILEECKKAGVYVAGYINDYDASFDKIKTNPNFVGTSVDGRYNGTAWGQEIAARVIAEGYKNIGMVKFPSFAFPHQNEMDAAFRAAIAEYNRTAETPIVVQEVTTELMFSPLDATYFTENPDLDAIFGMCAGVQFIYPTMVAEGKTNIKLYTAGLVTADDILANFGTAGNACIQEIVYCSAESITYPLVMLLNKIHGHTFSDQPTEAQRVDCSQIRIQNNDQLNFLKANNLEFTGKVENAFFTAKDVKALLAENGGTHAKLVSAVQHLTIEDLQKKVNG